MTQDPPAEITAQGRQGRVPIIHPSVPTTHASTATLQRSDQDALENSTGSAQLGYPMPHGAPSPCPSFRPSDPAGTASHASSPLIWPTLAGPTAAAGLRGSNGAQEAGAADSFPRFVMQSTPNSDTAAAMDRLAVRSGVLLGMGPIGAPANQGATQGGGFSPSQPRAQLRHAAEVTPRPDPTQLPDRWEDETTVEGPARPSSKKRKRYAYVALIGHLERRPYRAFGNGWFRGDAPKITLSAAEKEERKRRLATRETPYIKDYPDDHPTVDSSFRNLMSWLQFYVDRLFQLHGTIVAGVAVSSARSMVEIFPSYDAEIRARLEFGLTTNPIGPEGLHLVSNLVKQVHRRRSGLHIDPVPAAASNAGAPLQGLNGSSSTSTSAINGTQASASTSRFVPVEGKQPWPFLSRANMLRLFIVTFSTKWQPKRTFKSYMLSISTIFLRTTATDLTFLFLLPRWGQARQSKYVQFCQGACFRHC